MYAADKVHSRITEAEREFQIELEQHSASDVDAFEQHLRKHNFYTYDNLGHPTGVHNLTQFEQQWILNEQLLVQCSAEYFLTRYAFLKNEENVIQRFSFRMAQRLIYDIICDLESREAAIEIMCLKARQLGVSTLIQLLVAHRIIFSYGITAIIGSADQEKTTELSRMLLLCYDSLPVWMRPQYTSRVESQRGQLIFGRLATGVRFQHGSQKLGIATGSTPTIYHLCLSGRTLLRTSNSRLLPIREVVAGVSVLTRDGTHTPVAQAWKSSRTNELTSEIYVWGTPAVLSCTRDHLVLTESGWKESKDIVKGDHLIYPVRPIAAAKRIPLRLYAKWSRSGVGADRMYIADFPANFELGRLVGLYLAEGSLSKTPNKLISCVVYALHRDETATVERWCKDVFGEELRQTQKRKTSKTALVCLNRRGFGEWLLSNFGEKDDKCVANLCWEHGEDFARGVIYGYFYGDGHFAKRDNGAYATSVRASLAFGIRELMASLGYGWSQIAYREPGVYYNRNCKAAWILTVAGETAQNLRHAHGYPIHEREESHVVHWHYNLDEGQLAIAVEVESVKDGFSEDFYDIEVPHSSHSFLTACGLVHNSEVAMYTDHLKLIDEGLWKAVHASATVFGFLESTGRGNKGWWADTWYYSRDHWPHSRMCPLFLPWFCGREIYPMPADMRLRPIPHNWMPLPDTVSHVAKSELYVRSNPLLRKHLGQDYRMPIEQQWYWEWNHEEEKAKGAESSFFQEMAGDDEEALQRSEESVFGHATITAIDNERTREYQAFGIAGQSIEDAHEPLPDDIDYSRERIPVRFASTRGETYRWDLIPLKFARPLRETVYDDAIAKLFVFHPPREGVNYSIGVDTSEGKGQDSSVIEVFALGSDGVPDIQVAEYASSYLNHVAVYPFVAAIASYYGQFMISGPPEYRWRKPYVSVEQVEAVGDVCVTQLIRMGYPVASIHHFTRLDSHPARIAKMKRGTAAKMGWFTYGWSRPILTSTFVHFVVNGWTKINSPWMLEEMRHYEVHYTSRGKVRMEHEEGDHDDRIMAGAMATFCPQDTKSIVGRSKKRAIETIDSLPDLDISDYQGQVIPASALRRSNQLSLDDLVSGSYRSTRR